MSISLWTPEREALFCKLWLAGEKKEWIAHTLGVSEKCVNEAKLRLGLPRRGPRGKFHPKHTPILGIDQTERARRMWRNGLGTLAIANALNVAEAAVYNSLSNVRSRSHVVSVGPRSDREADGNAR